MEQSMEQTSAAEQRAFAVAKLKRAASLPRMKDGRRPPMHVEAVSEGEKAENDKEDADTPPPEEPVESVELPLEEEVPVVPDATSRKRRSRSRSRSRGSKDFRGKSRAAQSPTPTSTVPGDSSQDETSLPPSANIPFTPLHSPIPAHFGALQRSHLLRPHTPTSPEHLYPGTSPSTPIPLPTLEALQRGLFRSNSAGSTTPGRMLAMHKLTGGTDTYEPSGSSTAQQITGKLGRNNTVSGGERTRTAARQFMLNAIGSRITKETDGEQASGAEDLSAPSPSPKRKRPRSRTRRRSSNANTGVSDSEFLSTSPNTPVGSSVPLPSATDALPDNFRATSATPNQAATPLYQTFDRITESPSTRSTQESPLGHDRPRRRSVVVEEEDDEHPVPPLRKSPGLPATPPHWPPQTAPLRIPHASDAPSHNSTDSGTTGIGVPIYLSATQRTPSKHDLFPVSPFTTPLKEQSSRDEEEEEVIYPENHGSRTPYEDSYDREISWIASPVPEIRMQIEDDDEDEEDEDRQEDYDDDPPLSPTSSNEFSRPVYDDPSPRASGDSQDIVIESETSADNMPSFMPPSPSSVAALSQTASILRASDTSISPRSYPARLSVASRMQSDRSPDRTPPGDFEDRAVASETSSKRNGDGSTSTWGKVKLTLSGGRRSRTNSLIRDRRDHTDSSISRESGASLASARNDKETNGVFAHQQAQQPFVQSSSASASILSLAPYTSPRAGASPVPAASSADLLKYKDAKLFPFPGMKKLEEARNRAKGLLPGSSSTPDITLSPYDDEDGQQTFANTTPAQTPDIGRERKLSHQASDSRLLARFGPPASGSPSTNSHPEYFDIPQNQVQTGGSLRLPMTLPGVKQWLSNKKIFSQGSSPSSPAMSPTSPAELRAFPNAGKKPSLSDLLRIRKDNDLGPEWEDISSDKSRTPTTATSNSASTLINNGLSAVEPGEPDIASQNGIYHTPIDSDKSSTDNQAIPVSISDAHGQADSYLDFDPSSVTPSPPEPASTTPDPGSSVSDYPPHSTSESSSSSSSRYSHSPGNGHDHTHSQGALVLERLDESLSRGSRSPMWASAIDDPPRKLVLSSPVFQVANSNTIKDRFLFLFTDLLVIAKPVMQDQDNIMDSYKPTPMDRKYIVKSVVLLRQLRINGDRVEPPKSSSYASALRNPLIRTFVHQFTKDADHAVALLFDKAGIPDDPVMLGHLLFRTTDLDRARLGEYLSRRSSKSTLRTYLDSFGFTGMRVDKALRVFLLSVNIPSRPPRTLEYMLDAFAGRWYEANAGMIAYDKDVAIRLVRALVQLNDLLYEGISQEPGPSHPQGSITSQSFVEAFKRWDPRHLVPDELLEDICDSLHTEKLFQAPPSSIDSPAVPITIKRTLPTRLTYKVQSEPIVLRIPQPDAQLTVHLYGQDLIFEPPELSFSKSSEASFRVTGTSLGPKKMIMCRSGPNALRYSGLPLSNPLMVERAFMRNTFQVAFLNHKGTKRRYMFSVNDPLIRHQWTVSLKRHIETATSIAAPLLGSASPGRAKFHRAAELMALKVLQDILIGPETSDPLSSTIYKALDAFASSSTSGSSRYLSDQRVTGTSRLDVSQSSPHIRSQSRSQVYHRHAAGRNEMDLSNEFNSRDYRDLDNAGKAENAITETSPRVEGRLWSGSDLELQCQQNSSIPLVLSFLQVGAPDHGGLGAS